MFEDRADRYLSVRGLVEKIYLRYRATGEYGAVYVWESEQALAEFRESDLGRTIGDAYRVEGSPRSDSRTFASSFGRRPMIRSSRRSYGTHVSVDRTVMPPARSRA